MATTRAVFNCPRWIDAVLIGPQQRFEICICNRWLCDRPGENRAEIGSATETLRRSPKARRLKMSLVVGCRFVTKRIIYPLQMLLMFELTWKLLWTLSFGLSQWSSGQLPPTFA